LTEDTADIDFIKDQVEYLKSVKNKIHEIGEVILTGDDMDALDKIAQTLTSFKFFLIADSCSKKADSNI
jgi:hypothetical protein